MSRIRSFVGLAAVVLLVGTASLVQAQSYWNVASGHWSVGDNWNPTGVPAPTGSATIDNNGTAIIDSTDGTVNAGNLTMGDDTGNGYLQLNAGGSLQGSGSNTLTELLGVGVLGTGSGIFTQTGGLNIPTISSATVVNLGLCSSVQLGYNPGGYGEYDMSGGSLSPDVIYVGGNLPTSGTIVQAGTGVFCKPAAPSATSAPRSRGRTAPLV